jgi:putative nucleotidyltransferase with HDIG domain
MSRRPERLHALTAADLSIAFSQALDLAEGKPIGHARRVCYIATMLADALELEAPARAGVFFGALLHDIGVTLSASDLCRVAGVDEDAIFAPLPARPIDPQRPEFGFADRGAVLDAIYQHCALGAEAVRLLELPDEAATAVARHHEDWDGAGYPDGLRSGAIPIEARILAAADVAEADRRAAEPLSARRHFVSSIGQYAGKQLDPRSSRACSGGEVRRVLARAVLEDLAETLTAMRGPIDARRSRSGSCASPKCSLTSPTRGRPQRWPLRRTADFAEQLAPPPASMPATSR